jgi:hypothetical protein
LWDAAGVVIITTDGCVDKMSVAAAIFLGTSILVVAYCERRKLQQHEIDKRAAHK